MSIRVMIAEDDMVWVKVLSSFLSEQKDIVVISTAFSREEAVKIAGDVDVDVILMDINLTENKRDGILAVLEIMQFSSARIIMVSSFNNREIIRDSFTAGAVEFVSKEDYMSIPRIIRRVYDGTSPVQVILEDYGRMKREELLKVLTPAEREIYELIEEGYSQSQIGKKLIKTQNTIRTQVKNILKKIGVTSSNEAVKKVKSKGLLDNAHCERSV